MIRHILTLSALAGLCCAQAPEVFHSPTAQFSVTKPASWFFLTAEQNKENLERTQLNDKQLAEALAKYATAPIVAFSKYREPYADLNPSFKINLRPLGELKGRPATEILGLVLPQLLRAFPDAQLRQSPKDMLISGLKGAYARIDYTLKAGGEQFPTASEVWIVPRGEYFFLIGAGTRQDERNGTRQEVAAIIESLKFE